MELLISNDSDDIDVTIDLSFSHGQRLAENLVNVLVTGLEHEDDIEGHENVLQVCALHGSDAVLLAQR